MGLKNNRDKYHKFILRLPKETFYKLRDIAENKVTSVTSLINQIIRKDLKNEDNTN